MWTLNREHLKIACLCTLNREHLKITSSSICTWNRDHLKTTVCVHWVGTYQNDMYIRQWHRDHLKVTCQCTLNRELLNITSMCTLNREHLKIKCKCTINRKHIKLQEQIWMVHCCRYFFNHVNSKIIWHKKKLQAIFFISRRRSVS